MAVDPRVASAEALATGPKLLRGEVPGVVRFTFLATTLLGVPRSDFGALGDWLESSGCYIEPPYYDLRARPAAGTICCERLRQALLAGLKTGLPFRAEMLEGCR